MNLWHTHDDGFRGEHVHEIGVDGMVAQHRHVGDDGQLEVVEVGTKRYKQPKPAPAVDDGGSHALEVDDGHHGLADLV